MVPFLRFLTSVRVDGRICIFTSRACALAYAQGMSTGLAWAQLFGVRTLHNQQRRTLGMTWMAWVDSCCGDRHLWTAFARICSEWRNADILGAAQTRCEGHCRSCPG